MGEPSKRRRMSGNSENQPMDTGSGAESSENEIYGPSDDEEDARRPSRNLLRNRQLLQQLRQREQQQQQPPEEDMITLTAYEVLARVEKAWQNEKLCMELLYPLVEETDCMHEQLKILEGNFPILSKRDLRLPIHQMEGERIRYLLVSYYRTRLNKIQSFPWFIKKQEDTLEPGKRSRLTVKEKKFLEEYLQNLESHLALMGTQHMPPSSQKIPTNLLMFQPNLDSYVFFKCHQAADIIIVDADGEEEDVTLADSSRYVMRYRPVSRLLHAEKIELT